MNDEEKMTAIHFALPTHKKNAYVRAAQQRGQKLVPWIIEALDRACESAPPDSLCDQRGGRDNTGNGLT